MKCFINSLEINCLIDTGSTICILHPRKYNVIPSNYRPDIKAYNTRLCLADGGQIKTFGYIDLPVTIHDITLTHKFIIAEIDVPAIIGYDFLSKFKCTLDLGVGILTLYQNKIQCIKESQIDSVFKVSLMEKVTIPPNAEIIATGQVNGDSSSVVDAIVESSHSKHVNNVLVAKTLVDPSCGLVPLRLANINDFEITLPCSTCVATCESVHFDVAFNRNNAKLMKVDTTETDVLPEYLLDLKNRSSENLTENQIEQLERLLKKHTHVFSKTKDDLGVASSIKHKINTGNAQPFKQPPRRIPHTKRDAVDQEIQRLIDCKIIEPSTSPWASNIVPVTKKDGSIRICVDMRSLNNLTIKDSYPLPRIDDSLDALRGSKWFSVLDLSSGYFQVQMDEKDKEKTAFSSTKGLFQFRVMAMGLCNGVATFQRLMEYVLAGLNWRTCLIYIDDIIVFSDSYESHLERLAEVLSRIAKEGLKISPKKCCFFQKRVSFLGHTVSADGVATDPDKIDSVKSWPSPKSLKDVRSFLGTCSYYRKFIRNFAVIAKPMHKLTEKNCPFKWTDECETAFQQLKNSLLTAPILGFPDMAKPFILDTDASGYGIGAVLSQISDGKEIVIAYFSKALSKAQRQYCVTRRELLAIVLSLKHFHHYLYGTQFLVRTDHGALTWLLRFKNPEGQMARWLEMLNTYNFTIQHRPGKQHGNADGLSRRPCNECNHCSRRDEMELESMGGNACNQEFLRRTRKCEMKSVDDDDHYTFQWLSHKTDVEMSDAQKSDMDISILYKLKASSRERPTWAEIAIENVRLKKYWSQWDRIEIINDVLYRKWIHPVTEQTNLQFLIPNVWKQEILSLVHDDPSAGHMGIHKTTARVQNRFYWVGYKNDVINYIKNCKTCSSRKQPQRKAKMKQYNVGAPLERIALDIIGPLPLTNKGNRYALIVADYFTKWVEGYSIPDIEAATIVESFITNFVSRFGVPREIHTDQGRQFESALFKELCKQFRINKTRTTAFRPQSDGLVERFNRSLEDILSKYINKNQRDWDEQLPWALMAYRSSEHDSTKLSPCLMMLGREIELPVDLIYGPHPQREQFKDKVDAKHEYVLNLQEKLWKVQERARKNIIAASDKQKRQYDIKAKQNSYKVGDFVWLYSLVRTKNVSPKLQRHWDGPYCILEVISDVIYKIQKSQNSKIQVVHHDRLKPYFEQAE